MVRWPSTGNRRVSGLLAQRSGQAWQNRIETLLDLAERSGTCTWWRTPEPMRRIRALGDGHFECVGTTEGPPDYLILRHGHAIAMEAKSTTGDRFPWPDLQPHQAQRLDQWLFHGGIPSLAIWINTDGWIVPWIIIRSAYRRWAVGRETGVRADRGTASLSMADIKKHGIHMDIGGAWIDKLVTISKERTSLRSFTPRTRNGKAHENEGHDDHS